MINITNKRFTKADKNTFFCGRPSPLGNPYELHDEEDRDEKIELYKIWFEKQLDKENIKVLNYLNKIIQHHKEHNIINLQCYCYPLNCHCNVIKDFLLKVI